MPRKISDYGYFSGRQVELCNQTATVIVSPAAHKDLKLIALENSTTLKDVLLAAALHFIASYRAGLITPAPPLQAALNLTLPASSSDSTDICEDDSLPVIVEPQAKTAVSYGKIGSVQYAPVDHPNRGFVTPPTVAEMMEAVKDLPPPAPSPRRNKAKVEEPEKVEAVSEIVDNVVEKAAEASDSGDKKPQYDDAFLLQSFDDF